MDDVRQLKSELAVATRVASTVTDISAAREIRRYAQRVEDKLLFQSRPSGSVFI
ncbi:hypothetical protein ACMGDM_15535 [Sphingomonas sp. DT-51]|uniref:hypothetical protein n=1 Tax=Sphingomonas sp. DT-51 TaxID=3396165 RepID=UPI003F1C1634